MATALSEPLQLRPHLRTRPAPGFDGVCLLDVMLIGLFALLSVSRMVTTPGASIDMVSAQAVDELGALPSAILTIDRNQLVFFGGRKIPYSRIGDEIRLAATTSQAHDKILLIKADKDMPLAQLHDLWVIAREAGFDRVHMAAEVPPPARP
jgi:biopolymer transport protein ExbD